MREASMKAHLCKELRASILGIFKIALLEQVREHLVSDGPIFTIGLIVPWFGPMEMKQSGVIIKRPVGLPIEEWPRSDLEASLIEEVVRPLVDASKSPKIKPLPKVSHRKDKADEILVGPGQAWDIDEHHACIAKPFPISVLNMFPIGLTSK